MRLRPLRGAWATHDLHLPMHLLVPRYAVTIIGKALACVEDVPLAEMWSQGVFIDRRHGLAVVVLVL